MKATQFIKDHGLEKAREVVDGAPEWATVLDTDVNDYYRSSVVTHKDVDLKELKRLVESVDLVNKVGGIENAKTFDEKCIYCVEHFTNLERLKQAIADYESIYGGGE
ncbi:hypothetical protein I6L30_06675 [Acinetobacter seifertii]|uniref:Phage protein n=2 Tax=Acinetobacter seifertii TaxID=1530123 RepID=A0ABX8LE94_9GAMM|nr:hypothetical protein [Acinetobacter seifertii]QXB48238.1 hypothetical protein I6L30_06675 [Acinetobacter seifertii]